MGDAPIVPVTLGLIQPLEYLRNHGVLDFKYFHEADPPTPEEVRAAHAIIVMRLYRMESRALATLANDWDLPFVYMTDDDIEAIDPTTQNGSWYHSIGASETIAHLCRLATATLVFSPEMREKFRRYSQDVRVFVATSGIDGDALILEEGDAGEEVRVGYAGSPTHPQEMEFLGPPLLELLMSRPEVVVESIGQPIPALEGHDRYRFFDATSGLATYLPLQRERSWRIGLAPLIDNEFNRAKTDNKYRTYGALGIAGIYSNVSPYSRSVDHLKTGLLVENTSRSWREAIDTLLNEAEKRQRIRRNALADTRARFAISSVVGQYDDLIQELTSPLRVLLTGDAPSYDGLLELRQQGGVRLRRAEARFRVQDEQWQDITVGDEAITTKTGQVHLIPAALGAAPAKKWLSTLQAFSRL